MTDERMTLIELVEKDADNDLVREMLAFAAERLMEMEVEAAAGAPKGVDASRDDVLAYMDFPKHHWAQISSTNPLERVNKQIKRRSDVVGIFPNDDAIIRLVGALMLEQNDEWAVARRYMTLETLTSIVDDAPVRLPAVAT